MSTDSLSDSTASTAADDGAGSSTGMPPATEGGGPADSGADEAGGGSSGVDPGSTGVVSADGGSDSGGAESTGGDDDFDCSVVPELPIPTSTLVMNIPGAEDFTFDNQGYLWGATVGDTALMRTTYDGVSELVIPNIGGVGVNGYIRGTRFLPDGDLIVTDPEKGELLRVDVEEGTTEVLIGGLSAPNGIVIDPSGMIYLTLGTGIIMRIDSVSGEGEVIVDGGNSYDGITFSPDYGTLYFNQEGVRTIHSVTIGADGAPGDTQDLAQVDVGILDGMTADVCGNVYVIEMTGFLYRMKPSGEIELAADIFNSHQGIFLPAVNFGSGVGGWERDHVYIMNFDGGVFEVDIGIPGRSEPHL